MRIFFRILLIPVALQLASCSFAILGKGHLKIVDRDCRPIKNKSVQVNNINTGSYLDSGFLTTETYVTDKNGLIGFYVKKNANKVVILLPGVKGKKRPGWDWYTAASDNDEVLFLFDKNISKELLITSADNPLVITYPYQKYKCYNNYAGLGNYYLPKKEAERKEKNAAAEKARLAAIKVVIPKYKLKAFGIIDFSTRYIEPHIPRNANESFNSGYYKTVYSITGNTNIIKKEQQKIGALFGIFVTASDKAVLHYCSDITYNILYPEPGLTDPVTGKTIKYHSVDYCKKHKDWDTKEFMMPMKFSSPWEIKSGVWVFQIKYKDSTLLEKRLIVE